MPAGHGKLVGDQGGAAAMAGCTRDDPPTADCSVKPGSRSSRRIAVAAIVRRIEPALQRLLRHAFRQRHPRQHAAPAGCISLAAVALTPRLAAILRLDMPAADSSTGRGFAWVIQVQACPVP
jgi:hypothetical protein